MALVGYRVASVEARSLAGPGEGLFPGPTLGPPKSFRFPRWHDALDAVAAAGSRLAAASGASNFWRIWRSVISSPVSRDACSLADSRSARANHGAAKKAGSAVEIPEDESWRGEFIAPRTKAERKL